MKLLDKIRMSREEEASLRKWLRSFYKLDANLTNKNLFSELTILKLIKMESEDRKRKTVLIRLVARYNKLRRDREWKELCEKMEVKITYAGVRH